MIVVFCNKDPENVP